MVMTRFGFGGRVFHVYATGCVRGERTVCSASVTIVLARASSAGGPGAAPARCYACRPRCERASDGNGKLLSAELRWPMV